MQSAPSASVFGPASGEPRRSDTFGNTLDASSPGRRDIPLSSCAAGETVNCGICGVTFRIDRSTSCQRGGAAFGGSGAMASRSSSKCCERRDGRGAARQMTCLPSMPSCPWVSADGGGGRYYYGGPSPSARAASPCRDSAGHPSRHRRKGGKLTEATRRGRGEGVWCALSVRWCTDARPLAGVSAVLRSASPSCAQAGAWRVPLAPHLPRARSAAKYQP